MRLIDAKELERQTKEAFKESPVVMGMLLRWIRKQSTIDPSTLRPKGGWISVEEKLPKDRQRCFIAYQFAGGDMRFFGEAMFHAYEGNGLVDRPHFSNEGVEGMRVTHWMCIPNLPLPKPPDMRGET